MAAAAAPEKEKKLLAALNSYNPRQKAAILMMSMGADAAAQIFKNLKKDEMEELTMLITEMKDVNEDARDAVLAEFRLDLEGTDLTKVEGIVAARKILVGALGTEKADEIMESVAKPRIRGEHFGYLQYIDVKQIASVLSMEQPQTIALILSRLKPKRAAEILKAINPEIQGKVAERIGMMDRISPTIVRRVEDVLRKQFSATVGEKVSTPGGPKMLADILNTAGADTEKRVFEALASANQTLVDDIKRLMLLFDDLASLPDAGMQAILREADLSIMALALKGSNEAMKALVMRNLSKRAAERLQEELEMMGPKPRSEVREAQNQIVSVARRLEGEGKLSLKRNSPDDEMV
jgi:flagellar motor switch protein FliG